MKSQTPKFLQIASIFIVLFSLFFVGQPAGAQVEHLLMRKLVVFPMKAPSADSAAADEAWWQTRDELSKSRRFLVASKRFLIKSDVYQARTELDQADAVILGKLLDAHAMFTMQLLDEDGQHHFIMTVYDGGNGLVMWKRDVPLHPSVLVKDQLPKMARRLVDDFIASLPYQGFTTIDSLIGQATYEEGDVKLAQVDLGADSKAQAGDVVQWIRVDVSGSAPTFQGGSKNTTLAEGKIVKIEQGIATVEISRATNIKDIHEYTLVRVPREAQRLKTEYGLVDSLKTTLTAELVAPENDPMKKVSQERRPLFATLSFVGSIAAFLLLAF